MEDNKNIFLEKINNNLLKHLSINNFIDEYLEIIYENFIINNINDQRPDYKINFINENLKNKEYFTISEENYENINESFFIYLCKLCGIKFQNNNKKYDDITTSYYYLNNQTNYIFNLIMRIHILNFFINKTNNEIQEQIIKFIKLNIKNEIKLRIEFNPPYLFGYDDKYIDRVYNELSNKNEFKNEYILDKYFLKLFAEEEYENYKYFLYLLYYPVFLEKLGDYLLITDKEDKNIKYFGELFNIPNNIYFSSNNKTKNYKKSYIFEIIITIITIIFNAIYGFSKGTKISLLGILIFNLVLAILYVVIKLAILWSGYNGEIKKYCCNNLNCTLCIYNYCYQNKITIKDENNIDYYFTDFIKKNISENPCILSDSILSNNYV